MSVQAQPLFDYVNAPDAAYKWEKVSEQALPGGGTMTELKLTSQVWQGLTWTHQLALVRPATMKTPDTAVLLINGGKLASTSLGMVGMVANQAGAPIIYLGDIPNQPLFNNLHEDALIAFTFQKVLDTGDKTWPLLYPMTKSAVRAMDAIEEFTRQPGQTPITKFVVTGASKRGWTTWFTGEADTKPGRIVGIAPIVFDKPQPDQADGPAEVQLRGLQLPDRRLHGPGAARPAADPPPAGPSARPWIPTPIATASRCPR